MTDDQKDHEASHKSAYGILRVGGTLVALSSDFLREVVPRPTHLSRLPYGGSGLMGAMILRDDTIPLVDLRLVLGLNQNDTPQDDVAVIISDKDRLVALLVDSIRGIATVDPSDMRACKNAPHVDEKMVFTYDNSVVSLLSPNDLFGALGLPSISVPPREQMSERQKSHETYLLCSCAGHDLAFRADEVDATHPLSVLLPSPVAVGICDGVVHYHGRDVPMIDTLSALGLGHRMSPQQSAGVVIRFPDDGFIAFEIDTFHNVVKLGSDQITDCPSVISGKPQFFEKAHIDETGRSFLIVEVKDCRKDPTLLNLSRTAIAESAVARTDSAVTDAQQLYLVFFAGKRTCCSILQASEIIRVPEHILSSSPSHSGYMGTITRHGQIIPIYCAARLFGREGHMLAKDSAILIVRRGPAMFGFTIERCEEVAKAHVVESNDQGQALVARRRRDGTLLPITDFARLIEGIDPGPKRPTDQENCTPDAREHQNILAT